MRGTNDSPFAVGLAHRAVIDVSCARRGEVDANHVSHRQRTHHNEMPMKPGGIHKSWAQDIFLGLASHLRRYEDDTNRVLHITSTFRTRENVHSVLCLRFSIPRPSDSYRTGCTMVSEVVVSEENVKPYLSFMLRSDSHATSKDKLLSEGCSDKENT